MEKVEARIKQSHHAKLAEEAKQQGRSVEEVLDQALNEYIEREQQSEVR